MIFPIQGEKYKFEIVLQRVEHDYWFFIRAITINSGRTSCINNLNAILSELGIEGYDPEFADSMWIVPRKKAIRFFKIAKKSLLDISFLNYIENQLDFDRMLGEWENVISSDVLEYGSG